MYFYDCTVSRSEVDEGIDEVEVIVFKNDYENGTVRLPVHQARMVAAEMLRLCDEIEKGQVV